MKGPKEMKDELKDKVDGWVHSETDKLRVEKLVASEIAEKFGKELIDTPTFKMDLVNAAIDRKRCPLASMPESKWRCDQEDFDGKRYHKGQEPQCNSGAHLNCPVFDAYYRHGIPSIAGKRRKK